MQEKKKSSTGRAKYSASFKREVARDYLSSPLGYRGIAEKYGLKDRGTIKNFVRQYRKQAETGEEPLALIPMSEAEKAENEALQNRIKELEKQLEQANLRAFAFDTLIDVAEEELGIEIRKKSGAKQSKK